jgi:hypothetical protein
MAMAPSGRTFDFTVAIIDRIRIEAKDYLS